MARKTKRAALTLTTENRAMLTSLAGSRTAPIREVERAKIGAPNIRPTVGNTLETGDITG